MVAADNARSRPAAGDVPAGPRVHPRNGFVAYAGSIAETAETAAVAEQLGYESVWIGEVSGYDAATMLTAIAAATKTMYVGTGIVTPYLRDPFLMAMTANALNEYSGGRFVLGLGASTQVVVERWHGRQWGEPLAHMREYTEIVRRLLAGESVRSSGLYSLSGARLSVPAYGTVPVFFGALGPRMLELAGRVADGVILNFPTLSYARRAAETVRRAADAAGRSPSDVNITAYVRTTVTDDPATVVRRYRSELLNYIMAPPYRRMFVADGYGEDCEQVRMLWAEGIRDAALAAVSERLVRDHSLIGPAPELAARIREFREAGIDNVVIFPIAPDAQSAAGSARQTIEALAPAKWEHL